MEMPNPLVNNVHNWECLNCISANVVPNIAGEFGTIWMLPLQKTKWLLRLRDKPYYANFINAVSDVKEFMQLELYLNNPH